jgi:hypothetical protein
VNKNEPFLTGFSSKISGSAKRNKQAILQDKIKQIGATTRSSLAMAFEPVLPEKYLSEISETKRRRIYDEATTLWAWISQILESNASCHKAVSNVQAWREQLDLPAPSSETKAYCDARKRLSKEFINKVNQYVLSHLDRNMKPRDQWRSLTLKAIDGSSMQLMDTMENQLKYPQPNQQKEGCGFPVAGICGVVNLSHGGWEALTPHLHTNHDHSSIYKVLEHFGENDLCLADRAYNSYEFMLTLLLQGCESLMRLHQARKRTLDWKQGTKLGKNDRLYVWKKSKYKPAGSKLTDQEWALLAESMTVRIVRFKYTNREGKSVWMYVVTSLLDPEEYPYKELCELYHERWVIELKFRDVKTMLEMEFIRAKSPELAEKTVLLLQLCYNMIYSLIQQASDDHLVEKSLISFKRTVDQILSHSTSYKGHHKHVHKRAELHEKLLEKIADEQLVIRKGRHEPRAKKRRPKNFQLMTKPRHLFKEDPHRGNLKKTA